MFDAGVRAYQQGDFKAAIQAFEQAYRIEQRPGLLFSIAQAHRRQYAVDRRAGHVAVALKYFRDYVVTVQQGGRRADAVQAMNELEPIAQTLEREGQLQPLEDQAPSTRLVVSSPVAEASITLDADKEPRALPFISEVAPGKHTLRITKDGFAPEERTVEVASGGVTALDIGLKELPGKVDVKGPAGASAWVDGRPSGRLPLSAPIEVAAGKHDVRVSLSGYEEHHEEVEVTRGGSQSVTASMRFTFQRKLAFGLAGGGALSLITGAILGGAALAEQGTASSIKGGHRRWKGGVPRLRVCAARPLQRVRGRPQLAGSRLGDAPRGRRAPRGLRGAALSVRRAVGGHAEQGNTRSAEGGAAEGGCPGGPGRGPGVRPGGTRAARCTSSSEAEAAERGGARRCGGRRGGGVAAEDVAERSGGQAVPFSL